MVNTYIVTGSSSGLGSSVVKSLRESGAEVIGIDWKGQPDITADLSDKSEVRRAMKTALSICPNPAGVVSNAGLSPIHDDLREIIEVNWFAAKEVFELSL
ncbi:MAG: SDR family NAD(P)-dependent oxidoreductase, partial [Actinomycetota bacterium]|nr:SDR family NAD(P)-dependent oxidoreductase [Actinomycetota bacterium]